ncbi:hypothetical protein F5B21DRAFT_160702 [Xylaria acuta]|nr:hypothetical protein F5B21DRAFT_160702 [Xylaria acuta]
MPEGSLFFSPAPYHVLSYDAFPNPTSNRSSRDANDLSTCSYGALLGTQFFHVLERPQFAILQRAVFPAYFGIQTAAPVVLALTYPGGAGRVAPLPQGISGVLHPANRWGVLVPLTAAFVTGLANLVYFLPETNKVTAQRRQQETKDGKRDKSPPSKDMKALNKKFGKLHGYSSLFNLVTFIATLVYGVNLAARIE